MDTLTSILGAPQVAPWLALGITMGAVFAGFFSCRRPGLVILVTALLYVPIPLTILGLGGLESFQTGIPLERTVQSGIFVAMFIFVAMGIGFFPIGWTIGALIAFVCVRVRTARSLLAALLICVLVLAIGAMFVFGWMAAYPTYTYRYRMTVTVDVDGQPRSASSVIEVELNKQPQILPEMGPVYSRARGDAVFVDLGSGRNVIALLVSWVPGVVNSYLESVVPSHFNLSREISDLPKYSQLQGRWDLPEKLIPTFVTSPDLNDSKTVRVVRPNEFEQALGAGVRLRGVTVEMTSDPISRGLEKRIPWLAQLIAKERGSVTSEYPYRFTVHSPYFVRN